MADLQNRIGYDDFVWWMGVIEDRKDPLDLGRCKVRIFGSHTDNLNLIPTDSLPWCSPIFPPNGSKNYESPVEGMYVMGFYTDGHLGQSPVMLGVFPGIPQEEPKPGVGFSAVAKAQTEDGAKQLQEETPQVPEGAPDNKILRVGKPSIPQNAFSANGTVLSITNSDLVHACDFRFLINLGDLNIGTIENPITLIQQAIADAKNKAAAIIRVFLAQLLDNFRIGLKGIIFALNLDPSGQLSEIFSKVRDAIRTINYYSRKLAEFVGSVALVVALVEQLQQIVEWIRTLPEKVLALLRDCLVTFQNAITTASNQITAIPGQVSQNLVGAFKNLETSTEGLITQSQEAVASANIPNTLITLITSPDTANVNVLTEYITSQYPNANVIISNTNDATFNVANSSTP